MNYKTIIIGGSFAGLSTAYYAASDEILIIEKQREPGLKQVSTCGTFVDVLTKLKCEESILKKVDTITFHSSSGSKAVVEAPAPLCTIDYRVFCESMASRLKDVEMITDSKVLKIDGNGRRQKEVHCSGKSYKSEIVVDCSGWRAVTLNRARNRVDVSKMAGGMESEVEYEGDTDSIHIYFGNEFIKGGYAWVFPVGETRARVGIGGYRKTNLIKRLKKFMKFMNVDEGKNGLDIHGGIIPCMGLKEPVRDGVFLVGDSCGQVLPLSGEGIRKTVSYGETCGKLITKVLNDELQLSEALDAYKRAVYGSKNLYDSLYLTQKMAIYAPDGAWDRLVNKLNDKSFGMGFMETYLESGGPQSKLGLLKQFRSLLT